MEQKFISDFRQSNLKVGINDEGLARLDERNSTAISAFKQALDEHEKRINDLFTHQLKELRYRGQVSVLRKSLVSPVA